MDFRWNSASLEQIGRDRFAEDASATTLNSPLLAIAPGPTRVLCSSISLPWRSLLVEKHASSPGERVSATTDLHVISMVTGSALRCEHRSPEGGRLARLHRAGTLMVTPSGPVPDLRLHTASEFIHCALADEFTRGVTDELDRPVAAPVFHSGLQDKAIQRIVALLFEELQSKRPLGRLYVDSLSHALATCYLLLDCHSKPPSDSRVSPLPQRILNRVKDKILANLETDLSLESLARESGYSRAHFLRMFRAATGMTPHQYVLSLRVHRAQECLREKNADIIDVALSCGFASQSHMTTVFRRLLEMTPAEFRRSASYRSCP